MKILRITSYALSAAMTSVLVLTGSASQAQSDAPAAGGSPGSILVGARAGANFNQFQQPGTAIAGNVGAFGRYGLTDFLEVQADLLYSVEGGGRRDYTPDIIPSDVNPFNGDGLLSSLDYINRSVYLQNVQLAISARLTLPELNSGAMVPRFIVGGSYSYNLAAFEQRDLFFHFNDGREVILSNRTENVGGDFFDHNLSAHGGFAMDYNLSNGNVFTMEFRYSHGFTNQIETEVGQAVLIEDLRTNTFSINFSYTLFQF